MDKPIQHLQSEPPAVRASDADRERTATLLRENYTEGRLSFEELQERLDRAYGARTFGDLQTLTDDLPSPIDPASPPVTSDLPLTTSSIWARKRDRLLRYLVLILFLVGIWFASGAHGSFWPIWPMLILGFFVVRDLIGGPGRSELRREHRRQRLVEHIEHANQLKADHRASRSRAGHDDSGEPHS